MDFIYFLSVLAGVGIVIKIADALPVWNRLGRSERWGSSREAMNDQAFVSEFVEQAQK